jgi:hypothetical protein
MLWVFLRKQTSVVKGLLLRCNLESTSGFVREHTKIRCRFPLPDNSQHWQETDIHGTGGIRTRNPKKRADAGPGLRSRNLSFSFIIFVTGEGWNCLQWLGCIEEMDTVCTDLSGCGGDLLQVPGSDLLSYKLRGMVKIVLVNFDMRRRTHKVLNFILCYSEKRKRISENLGQSGVLSDFERQDLHQWSWKALYSAL